MGTQIVTLTTDWGNRGFFNGMVKGFLYSRIDNLQVIDNTHYITPYSPFEAAFVVKHSCPYYPKGTIHIIDVLTKYSPSTPFVVVVADGQYYICCDNGLPFAALGDTIESVWEIPVEEKRYYNFAAYTSFVTVAVAIAQHNDFDKFLNPYENLNQGILLQKPYMIDDGSYNVQVQYIDSYGNIYLGITIDEFRELRGSHKNFELRVRDKYISKIYNSYYDQVDDLCLTVSATGLLEVARMGKSFMNSIGNGNIKIGSFANIRFF